LLLQAPPRDANNHRHEHVRYYFKWLVVGSLKAATQAFCTHVKGSGPQRVFRAAFLFDRLQNPQGQMQRSGNDDA
jgi:hypothetical protein